MSEKTRDAILADIFTDGLKNMNERLNGHGKLCREIIDTQHADKIELKKDISDLGNKILILENTLNEKINNSEKNSSEKINSVNLKVASIMAMIGMFSSIVVTGIIEGIKQVFKAKGAS